MKRWIWAAAVLVVLAAGVVLILATTSYGIPDRQSRAVLQAEGLIAACEAFREHPDSGKKYPATLAELVNPPWGGSSYLKHREQDLIDPWGNPFKYAIVPNEKGEPEVYVWTELTRDGKTTLLGAKQTADGKTHLFGL
ncbi:MAG TPA: hypothetical protein VKE74_00855 [Gemmataceae bacterium]|nr:hypothetical protein [Gemmataceae bacterium]